MKRRRWRGIRHNERSYARETGHLLHFTLDERKFPNGNVVFRHFCTQGGDRPIPTSPFPKEREKGDPMAKRRRERESRKLNARGGGDVESRVDLSSFLRCDGEGREILEALETRIEGGHLTKKCRNNLAPGTRLFLTRMDLYPSFVPKREEKREQHFNRETLKLDFGDVKRATFGGERALPIFFKLWGKSIG